MSTNLFHQLQELRASRTIDTDDLARQIANGRVISATELDQALTSQEIDFRKFQARVGLHESRNQLRVEIQREAEIEQQIQELRELLANEQSQLDEVVARHRANTLPMRQKLQDLSHSRPNAAAARIKLVQECPSNALKYQLEETARQIDMASTEIETIREQLQFTKADVWHRQSNAADSMLREPHSQRLNTEEAASQIPLLQERLREARNRYTELIEQKDELERRMISY